MSAKWRIFRQGLVSLICLQDYHFQITPSHITKSDHIIRFRTLQGRVMVKMVINMLISHISIHPRTICCKVLSMIKGTSKETVNITNKIVKN